MFAQGFRPASSESHKNTFAFMHLALGREYAALMTYFDRMRAKPTGLFTRRQGLSPRLRSETY
jgi:hypothetical protein